MSINKPLVSVIIAAYNHEKYIQETINSIINQSYQNIELIIIDDGSKDSTWQKIQEIEDLCKKRFSRAVFKTKENEGVCITINKLLDEAQGEFIYFIASDDLVKPTAIEKQISFLLDNPDYSLIVGDNEIIDSNSKVCYWDKKRNNVYDIKKAKYKTFGEFLQKRKKINFSSESFGKYETIYPSNYIPNGYLVRKYIFDIIGYFTPEAPLEDYWLMLQISKYSKMKFINEILFSYRWHDSNTIKNTEKMALYAAKTQAYEKTTLKNTDKNKAIIDVDKILKEGVLYKKRGIPNIFEIHTFAKNKEKIKIFKLFGIKIFNYKK